MTNSILVNYQTYLDEETGQLSALDSIKQGYRNKAQQNLNNLPYDYAHQPWLYFIYDNDRLKCHGTKYSIPFREEHLDSSKFPSIEKIYPQLFSILSNGVPVYQEIVAALDGMKFHSYYQALMKFKLEAQLTTFPLFDLQENISLLMAGYLAGFMITDNFSENY